MNVPSMEEPVQVTMPAGLLPRLEQWLATAGMRVYAAHCTDGVAYLVGADIHGERPDGPWTLREVADGYNAAVTYLAEREREQKPGRVRGWR